MAKSTPVKKAWRSLTWLGVLVVVLLGTLTAGVLFSNATWLPKLALDLEGGTQIILAPQVENGQTVQQQQLDQAVSIIRQRIDASGISEAQISTEGSRNIVVSLPGKPDQATLDRVKSSARLDFRWHDVTGGLPDRYDFIVSNPPFHTQSRADRPDIGQRFITAAAAALKPGGRLWLVANRHLPYEQTLNDQFGEVRVAGERDGFKVIAAVKAKR